MAPFLRLTGEKKEKKKDQRQKEEKKTNTHTKGKLINRKLLQSPSMDLGVHNP